jgi:hypothetical protein
MAKAPVILRLVSNTPSEITDDDAWLEKNELRRKRYSRQPTAQLFAAADFGPASDALTLTLLVGRTKIHVIIRPR